MGMQAFFPIRPPSFVVALRILSLAATFLFAAACDRTAGTAAPPAPADGSVAARLASPDPPTRAAACVEIGRKPESRDAWALVPRLSDADWRVRAAAFESLRSVLPPSVAPAETDLPLRDTPVAAREQLILSLLDRWRAAPDAKAPPPELCELYLPPNSWLAGTTLAGACFACHAPQPAARSAACVDCHRGAAATFARSAHAMSTTHLFLRRIDDATKQVVNWDYGDRPGVTCIDCHRPDPATPPIDANHNFPPGAAARSCAACHADEQREYDRWRSHPRPRPASWPPGELTLDESPAEAACVSCHMRAKSDLIPFSDHGFSARRNPTLLAAGLHARIEPAENEKPARLVLTNLAGHAYPTGTHRRALRIDATLPERQMLAHLGTARLAATTQPSPDRSPLSPAEERSIALPPTPPGPLELTYERNPLTPGAFQSTFTTVRQP